MATSSVVDKSIFIWEIKTLKKSKYEEKDYETESEYYDNWIFYCFIYYK